MPTHGEMSNPQSVVDMILRIFDNFMFAGKIANFSPSHLNKLSLV